MKTPKKSTPKKSTPTKSTPTKSTPTKSTLLKSTLLKSTHQKDIENYCTDILSGKIISGIYTQKAIQRFKNDLAKQKNENYPYIYCPEMVDEVINFAESLIIPDIQRKDGTKNLILLPWHKFIYSQIWGWRYKTNINKRRFRSGYNEIARKNSKTTSILFPFILYDFLTTDAAESYFVSKDGALSYKTYKEMLDIIKEDKNLRESITETVSAISLKNSRISFFSSESVSTDGYKNSLSIIDEFHSYDTDKIVSSFQYGGRARLNCLTLIITSAGSDITLPCYDEHNKCKKILNGIIEDDSYFGIIYAYDDGDDWMDDSLLIKANPSLGTFLTKDVLLNDLHDAIITPRRRAEYKSRTCGIWTNEKILTWLSIQQWEQNKNEIIDEKDLISLDCYAGIDLSATTDFSAYTLYFHLPNNKYYAKHKFYIPSDTLAERYNENIMIPTWADEKIITATQGKTIKYDVIAYDIIEDSKKYNIKEIALDKTYADGLMEKLDIALPETIIFPYAQNLMNLSPPTKEFEKTVLDGNIIDNNPVMLWMITNVQIRPDTNDNYKPYKDYRSSNQRIDGVITSIMALDRLMQNEKLNKNKKVEDFNVLWF